MEWLLTTHTFLAALAAAVALPLLMGLFSRSGRRKLGGKHVVITGGSKGIGLALAEQCVRRGSSVTLLARSRADLVQALEKLTALAESLGLHPKLQALSADTTSPEQVRLRIAAVGGRDASRAEALRQRDRRGDGRGAPAAYHACCRQQLCCASPRGSPALGTALQPGAARLAAPAGWPHKPTWTLCSISSLLFCVRQVKEALEKATKEAGPVDVLVCNAGLSIPGAAWGTRLSLHAWRAPPGAHPCMAQGHAAGEAAGARGR